MILGCAAAPFWFNEIRKLGRISTPSERPSKPHELVSKKCRSVSGA